MTSAFVGPAGAATGVFSLLVFPKDPSEPNWLGSGKGEEEEGLLSFVSIKGETMKWLKVVFGDTPKRKVFGEKWQKMWFLKTWIKKFELRCSKYINPLF